MAPNLPPKRKPDAPGKSYANDGSAAARKRAKTYDARSLAVQSADAALSASGELDVAAYLEAREFEIRSLESGMQRSKAALTTRAFQQVPRSLRRRTASHNVKRVPSRLRARAKKEMAEDNTPTVSFRRRKPTELMRIRLETARRLQNLNSKTKAKRAAAKAQRDSETRKELASTGSHAFDIAPRVPKIKKNKLSRPPAPESKYKKRQRCKTWLPTHMFHAKRAHMATSKDPLWRFALPLSPTEKSYRPSHRARGARGAVAWDMSYVATIQMEGVEEGLERALRAVGVDGDDAWGVKGRKWRAGTRSLRAWVFESGGMQRPIAPVTLVRCAEVKSEDVEMADAGAEKDAKAKAKKKVFLRVHPSAFLQLWNELLEVSKKQNPPVMVEDLRFEIGSIDITGPGSTEALISALRPLGMDGKQVSTDSVEATWSSLLGVSNPSSLPLNALLGFSISDPRLHFPPQSLKPPSADSDMQNLAILLSSWTPDCTQQTPALFDRRTRLAAARQLPSQKAINRRRTEAGPGELPTPVESDPRIPVIVLASRSTAQSKNSNAPGYWTILLPWKCVTPVWYSLMYHPLSSGGNPRFGGLKEQQQLAFEGGEPWFPGDFPGTQAGWEWGLRQREEAKQEWERRPKGRRVEFASLDLGNGQKGEIGRGWACDWEKLLQIASGSTPDEQKNDQKAEAEAEAETNIEKDLPSTAIPPLNITQLPPTKATRAIHDPSSTPIDSSSLATVRVSLLNRGTPTPRARIYRLPTTNTELRQQWLQLASNPPRTSPSHPMPNNENQENERSRLAASLITPLHPEDTQQTHLPLPTEEDLIGFVTTGNYNLSEGKGTGIGSILVSRVVRGSENFPAKAKKSRAREVNMCIVRAAGERVGRVGRWEVV
ncbi:ribonuclease P/MRP protein subunit POP1 [Aspergillus candidus]|uniref:Putative ribonuclease P complex subunit Pop1 n=1 Tax=Aspergillus candidus TaxID=41067 RepID=A0A2I2EYV2_ASPCN|nr:putative ribonuclease P complex subunit Pop1 [Aspergillus candidus]PLB33551.1 putative ribonuclease P complex subunit Pop1 [Aspergillus candidus]